MCSEVRHYWRGKLEERHPGVDGKAGTAKGMKISLEAGLMVGKKKDRSALLEE